MDFLFIGTSGWTYRHWKGDFYPHDLPVSQWFSHYCSQFNAVEINATFYHRFQDATFLKWYERTPPGFCFVLKIPRIITHRKFLSDCFDEIREFSRQAGLLKEKLGCMLMQLPPGLKCNKKLLEKSLDAFPESVRLAVEFRHASWYEEGVIKLLLRKGVSFVNADSPQRTIDFSLQTAFPYLRFHGRNGWYNSDYTEEELRKAAVYFAGLTLSREQPGFAFFNNDFGGFAPRNAIRLMEMTRELLV
ncbi:MAG: DUF72 domain-containing protein [Bacteroidales bacterium]